MVPRRSRSMASRPRKETSHSTMVRVHGGRELRKDGKEAPSHPKNMIQYEPKARVMRLTCTRLCSL